MNMIDKYPLTLAIIEITKLTVLKPTKKVKHQYFSAFRLVISIDKSGLLVKLY